ARGVRPGGGCPEGPLPPDRFWRGPARVISIARASTYRIRCGGRGTRPLWAPAARPRAAPACHTCPRDATPHARRLLRPLVTGAFALRRTCHASTSFLLRAGCSSEGRCGFGY